MAINTYPVPSAAPQTYTATISKSGNFSVPLGVKTIEVLAVSGNDGNIGAGVVKGILNVEGTSTLTVAIGAAGGTTTINSNLVCAFPPGYKQTAYIGQNYEYYSYAGGGIIRTTDKNFTPINPIKSSYMSRLSDSTNIITQISSSGNPGGIYVGNIDGTAPSKAPSFLQYGPLNYQNGNVQGATQPGGQGTGRRTTGTDVGGITYGRASDVNNATAYAPGGYATNYGAFYCTSRGTSGSSTYYLSGVATSPTIAVAVHTTNANVYWTANPSNFGTWTERTTFPSSAAMAGIAFGNSTFVAVPQTGQAAFVSAGNSGTSWNTNGFSASSRSVSNVVFAQGQFFICSDSLYFTSTDGVSWTQRTSPATGMTDILWHSTENKYYCWGSNGIATSTDGITWTVELTGFSLGKASVVESPYGVLCARGSNGIWLWGNYIAKCPPASADDLNGAYNTNGFFGGAGGFARLSSNPSSNNFYVSGEGIDGYGAGNAVSGFGSNGNQGAVILKWVV
jgi:hypothetical protein